MREYLKTLRKANGYTQVELSKKMGYSDNYYPLLENADRQKDISVDLIVQLADIFNVPVLELIKSEMAYKRKLIS